MDNKPTYEELEQRVRELEKEAVERKLAEKALRESEEQYRSLFETAKDAIFVADETGRFVDVNNAACELLGYTREELLQLSDRDIDDDSKGYEAFLNVRNGKVDKITFQVEQKRKDGTVLPVEITGGLIKNKKQLITLAIARDITERKRLEAQVIQSAKMASLGVMAGGIAHEIRNPLAVCSLAAQLMLTNPNNRVLREECADKIYSNVHRATRVIENLLKFARGSRKDFEPVNLNEALELSLSLIEHQIRLQQIELNRELAKDLPRVIGNTNLLQQVFLDLILNAYNAMPEGGKLTISTLVNSDGEVEVRFADTGFGIPRENLEYIFDPFFTTMPVGKGAGLGLSASYGIIQQHGGSLEVESKVDVGSTFTVKLPLTRDKKPTSE